MEKKIMYILTKGVKSFKKKQ